MQFFSVKNCVIRRIFLKAWYLIVSEYILLVQLLS